MRRRGDKLGKVQFSELQKPHDFGLDLGSGHTAYHRALLIDLYLRTQFHIEIGKTFGGRMEIRTYLLTDITDPL